MATFGKAAFNTAVYGSFRPTYPRQLFDFIFDYHGRSRGARWDVAIDLGCGTGQATTELTPFKRVIGVDPSTSMLTQARQHTASLGLDGTNQFSFVQSAAEDLRFLENDSVDLIVSSQASHWFDWNKFWPEAARVLRSGGTTAHWIYSEFRLSQHPSLTPIITEYAQGTDPATSLGPHFQRPGRTILENHLLDVPTALDVTPGKFQEYSPVYFTG
jgi:ubiquinone/menaquinone biosynthesis C-methylase UbiE